MRALSLWQPWASLIYDERKKIETRHWKIPRGVLAIHAAMMEMLKKFDLPVRVKGHQGIWYWNEKAEREVCSPNHKQTDGG